MTLKNKSSSSSKVLVALNNLTKAQFQANPFHLVEPSPWPILTSFSLFILPIGAVMSFNNYPLGNLVLTLGLLCTGIGMAFWFRDIISEATYQGHHTTAVTKGITLGFALFILSEVCFFVSIFWAFFHSSLSPAVELGNQWPPMGITAINPFELPLLNTIILLSSGATVTYAHHTLLTGNDTDLALNFREKYYKPRYNLSDRSLYSVNRIRVIISLGITIALALLFTCLQAFEYYDAPFTLADSAFGTCFFFSTGFHGIHVIIGTIFLSICFWRFINYQFSSSHHLGFESAILYWHFVDVVWLFLFLSVYWWGS